MLTESSGQALVLSEIQTLIKLYQEAIEYYSATDDDLYQDVLERMQALMRRPEVEVLMATAAEESQQK